MPDPDTAELTSKASGPRRILIHPADRVLFIGDSVTDSGRTSSAATPIGDGYVSLIAAALADRGIDAEVMNRGVSGNRSGDLLRRWEEDCLALAPDVVSILVGINDTWRRFDSDLPTTTAEFESTYRSLLDATIAGEAPQIVLITPFLLAVQPGQEDWFEDLEPKIDVIRRLASEYGVTLIPADRMMADAAGSAPEQLAADGVHPTAKGHQLLAEAWLSALDGADR